MPDRIVLKLVMPLVGVALSVFATAQDRPFVPHRVLVKFNEGTPAAHAHAAIASVGAREVGRIPQIGVFVLDLPFYANETAVANALSHRPNVEFAELDGLVAPGQLAEPNDLWYPVTWHLKKLECAKAWAKSQGSPNVVVAVLDTGCSPSHPDLANKYVQGWNVYNNNSDWSDVHGHGTLVAGVVAAETNNSIGIAAIGWSTKIMPIRISAPDGWASFSAMATGITWAADRGAKVANLSYNGAATSSTVASAAGYMQSKGGVVTVAAGNSSAFVSSGDDSRVLIVTATDEYDALASFSNTGNNVDLAAPGVAVRTTTLSGSYGSPSGTSFSAPCVAGVAALLYAANPALTASQVQQLLKDGADDLGAPGWDASFGWGRLNAFKAVSLAASGSTGSGDTSPPNVSFSSPSAGATVSGTVSVVINASDNSGIESVTFSVDGVPVGTKTASPYTWTWNTSTVANGAHNLTATAKDLAGNQASNTITVNVNNTPDTSPPSVTITSPAEGSSIGNNVSVTVSASDDRGVVRVELYVNGSLASTSTSAPFTTTWNSRKAASGNHALQTKAYDAAGNSAWSQVVTVVKSSGGGKGGGRGGG